MINFYSGYIDASLVEPLRQVFRALGPQIAELRGRYADDPAARGRAVRALFQGVEIPASDLSVLLDHFDHAIAVAGPDHVGIGADWDGVASMPRGLE
jgi:membrane dipeptidase